MRSNLLRACIGAGLLSLATATASLADEMKDCLAGQKMVQAALKKKQTPDVQAKLRQALQSIGLEIKENDWDECVTYVAQAKEALQQQR